MNIGCFRMLDCGQILISPAIRVMRWIRSGDISQKMKQVFLSHDIPVALGKVFQTAEEGWNLLEQFGYPVIVKPDSGVGASDTYKIKYARKTSLIFDQT